MLAGRALTLCTEQSAHSALRAGASSVAMLAASYAGLFALMRLYGWVTQRFSVATLEAAP
jgi:hypothetical protein